MTVNWTILTKRYLSPAVLHTIARTFLFSTATAANPRRWRRACSATSATCSTPTTRRTARARPPRPRSPVASRRRRHDPTATFVKVSLSCHFHRFQTRMRRTNCPCIFSMNVRPFIREIESLAATNWPPQMSGCQVFPPGKIVRFIRLESEISLSKGSHNRSKLQQIFEVAVGMGTCCPPLFYNYEYHCFTYASRVEGKLLPFLEYLRSRIRQFQRYTKIIKLFIN